MGTLLPLFSCFCLGLWGTPSAGPCTLPPQTCLRWCLLLDMLGQQWGSHGQARPGVPPEVHMHPLSRTCALADLQPMCSVITAPRAASLTHSPPGHSRALQSVLLYPPVPPPGTVRQGVLCHTPMPRSLTPFCPLLQGPDLGIPGAMQQSE